MPSRKKTSKQDQSARPAAPRQKRNPSREPYASPFPDDMRSTLDIPTALAEIQRATRKSEAAQLQIKGGRELFVSPEASDMSAAATVSFHLSMVESLAQWGKQSEAGRSKGGKNRGQQRKDDARDAAVAICIAAMELLASHAPREISGILMQRGYGSRDKILRALRDDPSTARHWPPRKKKPRKLSV